MSDTTENVEQDSKHDSGVRKRIRHRKRLLYDKILKQMEFYFGDANLSKDRFLGDLIKSDPYVPLETFLKFNKIRSMTQDVVDIAKGLKFSTILELSEDKTKVKRKTAILPYDADIRTVYVESIPVTANREWLEAVFKEYGPVAYISLPKFRNAQRIKGYAFIEFVNPEDCRKCLDNFTEMGCKLPTFMAPEELSTIKMFSIEEPLDEKKPDKEYEPPKKKKKGNKEKKKSLELKLEDRESDSEKRLDTPSEDETKSITTPTKAKPDESKDEETPNDSLKTTKKPRKRSARERSKAKKLNNIHPDASRGALYGLQVLSKTEWKSLRNKYLNLQRKNMKELKRNLRVNGHSYSMPTTVHMEQARSADACAKDTSVPLEKIPGVFVKTELPEPCLDVRLTKRQVRSNVHVQHVEVKEGQTEMILRFDTAEAATQYCTHTDSSARVLSGVEEECQWERAVVVRRARGKARLEGRNRAPGAGPRAPDQPASPQPTATHIRFDD